MRALMLRPTVTLMGMVVLLLFAWEGAARRHLIDTHDWPAPSAIAATVWRDSVAALPPLAGTEVLTLPGHVARTLQHWSIGFLAACLLGVPIGFALGRDQRVFAFANPPVDVLRSLPSAAVWPLAVMLLGLNAKAPYLVTIYGGLWPVVVNTTRSVRHLQPEIDDSLRFMHLEWFRRYAAILRSTAPGILTGVELACGIALLLTVTVEWFYPNWQGIGSYLYYYYDQSRDQARLFGGVLLTGLVGFALNTLVQSVRSAVESTADASAHQVSRKQACGAVQEECLRACLMSNSVTETIDAHFGPQIRSRAGFLGGAKGWHLEVLRHERGPYMYPRELEGRFGADTWSELVQRDIRILVRPEAGGADIVVLFARSWIATQHLPKLACEALATKEETIGQIVRTRLGATPIEYADLSFRDQVLSQQIGLVFKVAHGGAVETVERARVIRVAGKPSILIQEFVPIYELRR